MATRIGFYTGKIYDESVDPENIKECCHVFNCDESTIKPLLDNDELLTKLRSELNMRCIGCNGCEEAQKDIKTIGIYIVYKEFESMITYGSYKKGCPRKYYSGKQIKDIIKKCLDDGTIIGNRRSELLAFKEKYMDSKYPISDNNLYSLSWYGNSMDELRCYKKQDN